MVFKRRNPRTLWGWTREMVYPQGGFRRATQYVLHRMRRLPDSPQRIARGVFAGSVVGSSCSVTAATKTRWGMPAARSSSVRRGEAEARMRTSGDGTRPMERNNPNKTTATALPLSVVYSF